MDAHSANQKLRRILEITRRMGVTADLDTLLPIIVDAACDVLDCERATIFLYEPQQNELVSRVARDSEPIRLSAETGIAGAAARQRACINVPDAYGDPRFNPAFDQRSGFRTRSLLAVPMENLDGQLIGVLQAINKRAGAFSASDEELARLLAAQAGVALDRARLIEAWAERQRMARDLALAREIQQAQFPQQAPRIDGYAIVGWNRPADETGGDCYDFIRLPDGRVVVMLADATGHGISAALIIAQFRSLMRALFSVTDDLAQIIHSANALLCADLDGRRFVTAVVGIVDPAGARFEYVAAGQGPLIHLAQTAASVRRAVTFPLGVTETLPRFSPQSFPLEPGDLIALLTDGFFEALNPNDEAFGVERVLAVLRRPDAGSLETLLETLCNEVDRFSCGQRQADDLTAVLIRRDPRR